MPVHRSIVRINRTDNTKRSFACCSWVCCYVLLNIIYHDYWIYINGTTFVIIVFGCYYKFHIEKNKYNDDSDNSDIDEEAADMDVAMAITRSMETAEINQEIIPVQAFPSHEIIYVTSPPPPPLLIGTPISPSNTSVDSNITVVAREI